MQVQNSLFHTVHRKPKTKKQTCSTVEKQWQKKKIHSARRVKGVKEKVKATSFLLLAKQVRREHRTMVDAAQQDYFGVMWFSSQVDVNRYLYVKFAPCCCHLITSSHVHHT